MITGRSISIPSALTGPDDLGEVIPKEALGFQSPGPSQAPTSSGSFPEGRWFISIPRALAGPDLSRKTFQYSISISIPTALAVPYGYASYKSYHVAVFQSPGPSQAPTAIFPNFPPHIPIFFSKTSIFPLPSPLFSPSPLNKIPIFSQIPSANALGIL